VLFLAACSRHDDLPPPLQLIDPPVPTNLTVETVDNITFFLTWDIDDPSVAREYYIYNQVEVLPGTWTPLTRLETSEPVDTTAVQIQTDDGLPIPGTATFCVSTVTIENVEGSKACATAE
jgi:hypothetical protein